MLVRVSADLEDLKIYAVGMEQQTIAGAHEISPSPLLVASFEHPVLLTDNARIARLPSEVRDAVIALYSSYPRQVEYLGVNTDWTPHLYPRVWCPSIDTLFFARSLRSELVSGVKSFAEIGCGSGFLTKFGLEYAREVTRASATDINLEAVRCTSDNLAEHPKRQMLNLVLPDANSADLGLDGQYDLVFSNPPYIPRPEAKRDNPYEGLELVAHLARQAKSILHESGRILINLSSLAGDAPLEWFAAQGLQVKALETMRVPLKVNPVTSGLSAASRAWRDYLEVQGRVEVDASEASGYRYWHQLRMFKIER